MAAVRVQTRSSTSMVSRNCGRGLRRSFPAAMPSTSSRRSLATMAMTQTKTQTSSTSFGRHFLGEQRKKMPSGSLQLGLSSTSLSSNTRNGENNRFRGFWDAVAGVWSDTIGFIRAGSSGRASRLGGMVIECNKKRGKGCTVRRNWSEIVLFLKKQNE